MQIQACVEHPKDRFLGADFIFIFITDSWGFSTLED